MKARFLGWKMEDESASICPYDEGVDFVKGSIIPVYSHDLETCANYPYAYTNYSYIVFRANELEIIPDTPFNESDWL